MKQKVFKPIIIIAFIAAIGAIVMLLWNAIIPSVIGWNEISYLQSIGLFILCRVLFGGFRGLKTRTKMALHCNSNNIKEQVKNMSKQERLQYIREYIKDEQK